MFCKTKYNMQIASLTVCCIYHQMYHQLSIAVVKLSLPSRLKHSFELLTKYCTDNEISQIKDI